MADDDHDDDATRIYRPYGSPPPTADEPDPFAPDGDPFAPEPDTAAPNPFVPSSRSAPPAGDPFAPSSDPFSGADPFAPDPPAPTSSPASPAPSQGQAMGDPFAPLPASPRPAPDPFAPEPSSDAPADDPFAPSGSAPTPASASPAPPDRGATDLFGPPVGDFGSGTSSDGSPPDDPFAPPPDRAPASDPVPGADPFAPPSADPFRAPDAGEDPFAPRPAGGTARDPFAPAASSAPDPFAAPPPAGKSPTPEPPDDDPFDVTPDDPFAPAPKAPAPQPRDREDPFATPPGTTSDDPFASLKGPSLGSGGSVEDSAFHEPLASAGGMELPETFGTERTLAGAFTPVFSLVLQIRAAQQLGDGTALRRRIEQLLADAARTARSYNVPEEDVEEATFCLVAFLDEAILATEWPGHDAWSSQPLQLTHYDRYDAGERFFDRLKRLLDEGATRTGVLEVYYLCLALGFKGRYAIHGREVLRRLVDDLHGRLERANGAAGALSPRGTSREVPAEAEKGGVPTWALWVGAAVLVALLYLGLSLSLSGVASETADDLRALTAAPAE